MFSGVRGDRLVRPWRRAPPVARGGGVPRGQAWPGSARRLRQEPSPGGRWEGAGMQVGGTRPGCWQLPCGERTRRFGDFTHVCETWVVLGAAAAGWAVLGSDP